MTMINDVDLNPMSPANLADPYPLFAHLRETDPVHWSEPLHGWLFTRYRDVSEVLRDSRFLTFKTQTVLAQQLHSCGTEVAKDFIRILDNMLPTQDGAEHAIRRKQANHAFTNTVVDGWRPRITEIATGLIDQFASAGKADLVTDFASPLAALVLASLYDIPAEERASFQKWSTDFLQFLGIPAGDIAEVARRANDATLKLEEYLLQLISERRQNPGQDMVSLFLAYQDAGKMNEGQITADLLGFMIAGHATTIDQISNGALALLSHPEALATLRKEPQALRPAVEEIIRYLPAGTVVIRVASQDMEFAGKQIKKGQSAYAFTSAANRDPEVFSDPERFDIGRTNNKHISFGAGIHLCIGNALARREVEIGLELLLHRLPNLRLDPANPPRRRTDTIMIRSLTSLPVLF